jgi:hypothetical protein
MCQCGAFEYHDFATLTCLPQQIINGNCSFEFNCRVDKYLECENGTCQCISAFPLWSDGYDQCIVPKTYTEFCYNELDCNSALNLVCRDGIQNCSCPINIQLTSYCDCVRSINTEYYWNGSSCTPAIAYNQACSNSSTSFMCKTLTEGTICSGNLTFICKCPVLQYYNNANKKCETQVSNSLPCSQPDACRSDLGLICKINICQCNSTTQVWNGATCINYFTYDTGTCASDSQCNNVLTGLICRTGGTSCNCPTFVATGKCDCVDRANNNEYYWNGIQCVMAGDHGDPCNNSYECQVSTKDLICDNVTRTCVCVNGTHNVSTEKCIYDPCPSGNCSSGWKFLRGHCYKNVLFSNPGGFETLTLSLVQTKCGASGSTLAETNEFSSLDYIWLNTCMCKADQPGDGSYPDTFFGPIPTSGNCLVYVCNQNNLNSDHDCNHGTGLNHHSLFCRYTP